jgi:16S rRNA (adenine1518-N6/adenine1519-N6)-dimethyltransferase
VQPKKSLSQHYLTDPNIARKIASSITSSEETRVVEIGPGYGMLTQFLFDQFNDRLFLIEIDPVSIQSLKEQFILPEQNIYVADFLTVPLEEILIPGTVMTGNLPYHITSPVFFRLLEYRDKIEQAVFMIQREVAHRICSHPGTKVYGLLSVLVQTFYEATYLFTVNEKVFYPRPRVQSAVIKLTRNDRKQLPCNEDQYIRIVKKIFGQRRKMIRNSLGEEARLVKDHPEFLRRRPEQMVIEDFISLCTEITG